MIAALPPEIEMTARKFTEVVLKGPIDEMHVALDILHAHDYTVSRSGGEVINYRMTNRYHIIARKEIE